MLYLAVTVDSCKPTAMTISSHHKLDLLGTEAAPISDVIKQATALVVKCYEISDCASMTDCRLKIWTKRVSTRKSTPKLCSLPPTTEAFEQNGLRAHLQVAYWLTSLSGELPALDPLQFGYESDIVNKILLPKYKSAGTPDAPESVLKLVPCEWSSHQPCKRGN